MSITRRLPNSDITRDRALSKALNKMTTPGPDGNFLTMPTQTRLTAIQLTLHVDLKNAAVALAGQSGSTSDVTAKKIILQRIVSHFIQVFNLGVARGKYPAAHRAFYMLDVNSDSVPPIGTEQEVTQWGTRIIEGDALRVTAGGVAMANPSAAEVATANTAFTTANTAQSGLKDTYDDSLEVIEADRIEADAVIKKVWDEVETFYNEETLPSMRRNAREWGVLYVSDVPITFFITATDSITGLPLSGVRVELLETGNTVFTNAGGVAEMTSHISAEQCTLHFSLASYIDQDVVVTITSDTGYPVPVTLVHV